jgi:hypothetical protein
MPSDSLGHPGESDRLRSTWEEAYGPMQTMLDFRNDVQRVVRAVYKGPYSACEASLLKTRASSMLACSRRKKPTARTAAL